MRKLVVIYILFTLSTTILRAQDLSKIPLAGFEYHTNRLKNDSLDANTQHLNGYLNIPLARTQKRLIGARIEYNSKNIIHVDEQMDHHLQGISSNLYWR